MTDFDEVVAACYVEYARRQPGGVLTGPFYTFGKTVRDSFNLPYVEEWFEGALHILQEVKVVARYPREGMPTYYKLDAKAFDGAFKKYALDVRYYTMSRGPGDGRHYNFLEAFADLGSDYLIEALDAFEAQFADVSQDDGPDESPAEADSSESQNPQVDSASWTGIYSVSAEDRATLDGYLEQIDRDIETLPLTNSQRAEARALVQAAQALVQSPNPVWDLVVAILSSPVFGNLTAVAALAVALIKGT